MERSSRVLTGIRFWMHIFPPKWIKKVRSEKLINSTPGRFLIAVTI